MTLTGNNAITLRKLTSKVAAEKGIPPLSKLVTLITSVSPLNENINLCENYPPLLRLSLFHSYFYIFFHDLACLI